MSIATVDALAGFSPHARRWFEGALGEPTPAQTQGWPPIAAGEHVLLCAPTGSGKTLAAFLWFLDRLMTEPGEGLRVLYISPLKALNYDVERNLRAPLAGIRATAAAAGIELPAPAVAVRTGDTPADERRRMLRTPPDVLITTPESLYLLLTSRAREMLTGIEAVIVDEVHAVAATKRGAHLALSLERLADLCETDPQRVALSATQRPLEEIARFVGGDREMHIVDAGMRKVLDLRIEMPADPDEAEPAAPLAYVQGANDGGSHSLWPALYPELLELVRTHHSTIVFVNSRRMAERLALRLNELAEEPIARAHHGSLSREARGEVEEALKAGTLPCIVATSSLELGIDMGAVDLVVQVSSPGSVASGLQRVGRAGHSVGMPSRGRIYPRFRGELVEAAAVARGMLEGEVEHTRVPRIPLDVLCQQIVAMASVEELQIDSLHTLVRRAYPYRELTREQLENVLDLLAGRYPSDEFAELRPRIVWERTTGALRAREGAQRIAIANAGTIPDRGLYGVFLVDGGGRVGELDEEMVHEAREGQVFLLGASAWRIEQIERDRVIVSPAPGQPAQVPFWKGEQAGRPVELGRAVGRLQRELAALDDESAMQRLTGLHACDERAARTLVEYLREQELATGVLPSDRTIVVERFRDEIGDWRLCMLSPFGARVHAPWGLALRALLREQHGIETHALWSDDGIILHLPDADSLPPDELVAIDPDRIEDLVVGELGGSSLFGARFRESAARALLIPRRRPGQRTPLWQQRLRAQSLLAVAERYGSFPILLETYRELLADHFDLGALRELLGGLRDGTRQLVAVESQTASPFAASLNFEYVAQYLYEDDAPAAERRVAALTLDRDLLRELAGLRRAARPARRRRARAGRAGARQRAPRRRRRAPRPAAPGRRPGRVRARRATARRHGRSGRGAAGRPPRPARAHRRRGSPDRRRGHRPLPRRARGDAAGRHARRPSSRTCRTRCARSCGASRAGAGRSRPGRWPTATTSSPRSPSASSPRSSARASSCAVRCARAAADANGATSRCCAASGARPWRACGARSRRSSSRPSRASCRPGTASGARAAAASTGCARCSSRSSACRSRPRSGSARCCRCAWTTGPSCSTSCARAARSCGSAPTPVASRSRSARTPRCSGRPAARRRRPPIPHPRPCAPRSRAPGIWPSSGRRPACPRARSSRPCGGSWPRARRPTTPGSRCGGRAGRSRRARSLRARARAG